MTSSEPLRRRLSSIKLEVNLRRLTEVFSEARLLESPEWSGHVGLVVRVDEASAGFEFVRYTQGLEQTG